MAIACGQPTAALPFGADAESCQACHGEQYEAWADSPHGTSGTSPVFEALLVHVEDAWGAAARDACVDCHQPGHGGDSGIGCVTCHAASGNAGERDGRLRVNVDRPLLGPTGAGTNGAHQVREGALLMSSSLCGTCHEVTGPGLLDEPTLTEHRASDFAERGVTCATCHMPEGEHRFVGLDPAWDGGEDERRRAIDDARALFQDAVSLEIEVAGDEVLVTLANVGAGHAMPTGATFLRDVWVDVSFDGGEPSRILDLAAEMTRDGAAVALITDADEVTSRSLAPGEVRRVAVAVPDGAANGEATLRLRAIRWQTLEALGLGPRRAEVPTIDVATAAVTIP